MEFNWPNLKTDKAKLVAHKLKGLCGEMERNELTVDEIIEEFVGILKGVTDHKHYTDLTNAERKEEFRNLNSIVWSIFMYFQSSDMHYKVRPAVFEANKKFFSYR